MKKLFLSTILLAFTTTIVVAQDSTARKQSKKDKKAEKRQRINAIIKQEEEGNLAYYKQNGFGIQMRTNGWGFFYELGKRNTPRFTTTYSIEFTEIKHPKEEKFGGIFSNPYTYGKVNNFYQLKLGYGQQYIFGQKGNKNGIAVIALAQAGLSAGMQKPYYLDFGNGPESVIKYTDDPVRFLSPDFSGNVLAAGVGPFKGWGEMKVVPGGYVKGAVRFDFGRYNESVQAIEIGMSLDYYSKKIQIMAPLTTDPKASGAQSLFFQGHIAFVFGRRK